MGTHELTYYIITPARDEADNLRRLGAPITSEPNSTHLRPTRAGESAAASASSGPDRLEPRPT